MPLFVTDASVSLAWCFEDEATSWTESILERLKTGDGIVVPAHWPMEVSNGLLMALRRGRIQVGRPELFWNSLSMLPIEIEQPASPQQAKTMLELSGQYGLTVYDAAYLELARRRSLGLATLDRDLIKAAAGEGIALVR